MRDHLDKISNCASCGMSANLVMGIPPTAYPNFQVVCSNLICRIQTPLHMSREEIIKIWNKRE